MFSLIGDSNVSLGVKVNGVCPLMYQRLVQGVFLTFTLYAKELQQTPVTPLGTKQVR